MPLFPIVLIPMYKKKRAHWTILAVETVSLLFPLIIWLCGHLSSQITRPLYFSFILCKLIVDGFVEPFFLNWVWIHSLIRTVPSLFHRRHNYSLPDGRTRCAVEAPSIIYSSITAIIITAKKTMTDESTPPKQAEKQFTTARTPKHNNRSAKKDEHPHHNALPSLTHHHPPGEHHPMHGNEPSPSRRRHVSLSQRPPSPSYDYYYGYGANRGPPLGPVGGRERGHYDYYEWVITPVCVSCWRWSHLLILLLYYQWTGLVIGRVMHWCLNPNEWCVHSLPFPAAFIF